MKQSNVFFADEVLNRIFAFEGDLNDRLISRENSRLEFKESFNLGSSDDYAKTAAAFANAQGGYIVFGVKDQPRELVGLQSDHFAKVDPGKLTLALNERFSPEIAWEAYSYEVRGQRVGLLYFSEASQKPVVCTRSGGSLKQGSIYYRYRGRSEAIRYPELRRLLDMEKDKERDLWLRHLKKMATVGIDKIGVLDLMSGEVIGAQGNFYISEDLLSKLQFVKEGQFTENSAAPALRIIGDLKAAEGPIFASTIKIPTSIREPEIIGAFLENSNVLSPTDFIRAICFEQTPFYPIYFYINQMSGSVEDAIELIGSLNVRGNNKDKIVARLRMSNEQIHLGKISGSNEAAVIRRMMLERLTAQSVTQDDVSSHSLRFLEAVTHTDSSNCERIYLLRVLNEFLEPIIPSMTSNTRTALRKALCHLDLEWYKGKVI